MSNTHPEPIIDKNGVPTTRHKKFASNNSTRDITNISAGKRKVTYDEVSDAVADAFIKENKIAVAGGYRPHVLSLDSIFVQLIGHDPTIGQQTDIRYNGGRSKASRYGDHLSVSSVNTILAQLVEDGVIVKVKENNYNDERNGTGDANAKFVTFGYRNKSGYVLTEALEDSKKKISDAENEKVIEKLRTQARATVADRYADEVELELELLRNKAGI